MVNCSGFWACHRMQSNHVSPSTLVQETGSIDLMQVQEGSSSMNEVNPDQRLPVTQSRRQPPKKSLRVSIWLKLTLFIGTLVGYYSSSSIVLCTGNCGHICKFEKCLHFRQT
jgi:hypothetical protein